MNSRNDAQPAGIPQWPELMQAKTAARYVDEPSVRAFRRRVGKVYPRPRKIRGRGTVWLKSEMDQAIANLSGIAATIRDAADVL